MAPVGTLIGPVVNQRNYKARIVANLAGVELATTPDFVMGTDNVKPEFVAKFASTKVPVFEGADGFRLTDSSAIASYVASKGAASAKLLGETDEERAEILQFSYFAEADYMPAVASAVYPRLGYRTFIKPAVQAGDEEVERMLGVLNTKLGDKTFLVGERITLADVNVTCSLVIAYQLILAPADREQFHNVTRYFTAMIDQPAFKSLIGDVEFCAQRIADPKPAEQ
ncbi:Elongation factor 1-gamma [Coemansia sp. RSA 552]|nr:Elongation factor 1-gamma [Coemansia sp. RSA 552]